MNDKLRTKSELLAENAKLRAALDQLRTPVGYFCPVMPVTFHRRLGDALDSLTEEGTYGFQTMGEIGSFRVRVFEVDGELQRELLSNRKEKGRWDAA